MKFDNAEQKAINYLIEYLEKVPFVHIEQINPPDLTIKSEATIQVRIQNSNRFLLIETKTSGQPRIARLALYQLKENLRMLPNAYGVFFAPYISPKVRLICEEAGIGYLDMAGNCLISFGTIYIHQTTGEKSPLQKRELRSLYSPKGERILRVLLNDPNRTWKMIDLARFAMVSLGQVANIKKLLNDREWLSVSVNGISLKNPSALLAEWKNTYLFERNKIREFYALAEISEIEMNMAETCQHHNVQYALTGFSSAARIAPMVRYQKASAYMNGNVEAIVRALNWKEVSSGGNVNLFTPYDDGVFFGSYSVHEDVIVSPVQTYLDLQHTKGRGQESAESILIEIQKSW